MEHDNLRAALGWLRDRRQLEEELRLAGALGYFWSYRGYGDEGLRWLEAGLALSDGEARLAVGIPGNVRAKALHRLGMLLSARGEHQRAIQVLEESLSLFHELGDKQGTARMLNTFAEVTYLRGDVEWAIRRLEESLALFREMGDRQGIADGPKRDSCIMASCASRDFESLRPWARRAASEWLHNRWL